MEDPQVRRWHRAKNKLKREQKAVELIPPILHLSFKDDTLRLTRSHDGKPDSFGSAMTLVGTPIWTLVPDQKELTFTMPRITVDPNFSSDDDDDNDGRSPIADRAIRGRAGREVWLRGGSEVGLLLDGRRARDLTGHLTQESQGRLVE